MHPFRRYRILSSRSPEPSIDFLFIFGNFRSGALSLSARGGKSASIKPITACGLILQSRAAFRLSPCLVRVLPICAAAWEEWKADDSRQVIRSKQLIFLLYLMNSPRGLYKKRHDRITVII